MKLIVHAFTTLDGVMQGPGGADEDRSGGFELGGWMAPAAEADTGWGTIVDGWFRTADELLYGRTTYELMAGYWPQVTDPDNHVAAKLNGLPKHVVTRTLQRADWAPTSIIDGDELGPAVEALKRREGGELQVHGSWQLVQSLHALGLVDEFRVLTFPVVVGQGKRLFDTGARATGMQVASARTTAGGIGYSVLRPTAPVTTGRFAVENGAETTVLT